MSPAPFLPVRKCCAQLVRRSPLPTLLIWAALVSVQLGNAVLADVATGRPSPCLVFVAGDYGLGAHINNMVAGSAMNPDTEYYLDDRWLQYRCNGSSPWSSLFKGDLPKIAYVPPHQNQNSGSFGASKNAQLQENNTATAEQPQGSRRRILQQSSAHKKDKDVHIPPDLQPHVPAGCIAIQFKYTHTIVQVMPDIKDIFSAMSSAMLKIWQFEPDTKAYVDMHVNFLLSLPKPLVAFHVRGGDKASEQVRYGWQPVHPRSYEDAIGNFTPSVIGVGGTCVYIGDDSRLLSEVSHVTSRVIKCTSIVEAPPQLGASGGHDQATFNKLADKCTMSRLLLAQIEVMAAADYFVGAYTSNVPRTVQLLRVAKYKHAPETGIDVLLRPWVPNPFAHPAYTHASPELSTGHR